MSAAGNGLGVGAECGTGETTAPTDAEVALLVDVGCPAVVSVVLTLAVAVLVAIALVAGALRTVSG